MIKAALFDLDGVVFDTEPQYTGLWASFGKRFRPDVPDLAYRIKGQTLVQILDAWFADSKEWQEQIVEELNQFEHDMNFPYIKGVEAFLTDLRQQGIKTAVVTSSNRPKMESVYRKRPEMSQLFDHILTSEDFKRSKPAPDAYLRGAEVFGVSPSECVGFEDSFNGLQAVRSAHMLTVALATTNEARLLEPLADVVIPHFEGIDSHTLALWHDKTLKK